MNRTPGAWCLIIVWNLLRIMVLCLLLISPVGLGGLAILSKFYMDYTESPSQLSPTKGCAGGYSSEVGMPKR